VLTTRVVQHCVASWPVVQEVEEDRRSRRRWRGRVEGGRRDEAQHIDQELPSSPPLPNKAPTMLLLLVSMACQVPRTTSRSGSGSAQATKNHHLLPLAPSNAYPRSDAHLHGGNGCGGTMEAKASILDACGSPFQPLPIAFGALLRELTVRWQPRCEGQQLARPSPGHGHGGI